MKKFVAMLCVTLLVALTLQPAVFAKSDDDDDEEYDELVQIVKEPLDKVGEIDLQTVLKRALDDSHNLKLLALKLEYLAQKQKDLKKQYNNLDEGAAGSVHLPVSAEEFMADPNYTVKKPDVWMGPVAETNTVVNEIVYGQGQIVGAINQFVADSRDKLKIGRDQAGNEAVNTSFQQKEVKEGIQLQETALYAQILSQQKQVALLEDYQSVLKKDLEAAKVLNELGMSSQEDIRTLEKALNKQKDDVKTARSNCNLALVQLSFDIGIEYNPNLKVAEIADLDQNVFVRSNTEELLNGSYQMQIANQNLNGAIIEKQDTDIKNRYQEDTLYTNIDIAKEKILQARIDLSKKIENTYNDAQNAYYALQTELRNNGDIKKDYEKMAQRFDAGVVSRHDFDKFSFKLRQSETMLALAKLKYYVLTKKISAMENGFIQ